MKPVKKRIITHTVEIISGVYIRVTTGDGETRVVIDSFHGSPDVVIDTLKEAIAEIDQIVGKDE